jgi:hypothetical protein
MMYPCHALLMQRLICHRCISATSLNYDSPPCHANNAEKVVRQYSHGFWDVSSSCKQESKLDDESGVGMSAKLVHAPLPSVRGRQKANRRQTLSSGPESSDGPLGSDL